MSVLSMTVPLVTIRKELSESIEGWNKRHFEEEGYESSLGFSDKKSNSQTFSVAGACGILRYNNLGLQVFISFLKFKFQKIMIT